MTERTAPPPPSGSSDFSATPSSSSSRPSSSPPSSSQSHPLTSTSGGNPSEASDGLSGPDAAGGGLKNGTTDSTMGDRGGGKTPKAATDSSPPTSTGEFERSWDAACTWLTPALCPQGGFKKLTSRIKRSLSKSAVMTPHVPFAPHSSASQTAPSATDNYFPVVPPPPVPAIPEGEAFASKIGLGVSADDELATTPSAAPLSSAGSRLDMAEKRMPAKSSSSERLGAGGASPPLYTSSTAQSVSSISTGIPPADGTKGKRRRPSAPRSRKNTIATPTAFSSTSPSSSRLGDSQSSSVNGFLSTDPAAPSTTLGSPVSAAGRWLRRVSSAPNTKAWFLTGGSSAPGGSPEAIQEDGRPDTTPPPRSRSRRPTVAQKPEEHGVPALPHFPANATGFGQYADGTYIPPSPSASVASQNSRGTRRPSKSVSMVKGPSRSRTTPGGLAALAGGSRSPRLEVPGSPSAGSDTGTPGGSPRAGFRRTYSSNSIKVGKAEVGPDSFEKIKLLGKGDVGKVYLVREKRRSVDIEAGIGTDVPPKLYAMKVLSKKEMIKRNKIKRALAEQVGRCVPFGGPGAS